MNWHNINDDAEMRSDSFGVTERVLLAFPEGAEHRVVIAYRDPYYEEGGSGYRQNGQPWVLDGGETIDLHISYAPIKWAHIPRP